MTAQKILIWLIGIVILVGVGLGVWLLVLSRINAPTQTDTTDGSTYYGGSNTSVATTNNGTQTKTQTQAALPDLNKAFDGLFAALLAQPVVFTRVATTTGDLGLAYTAYKADIDEAKALFPNARDFSIGVAPVDLNSDGTPEGIVLEDLPGWCGSGGCPLDIYRQVKGKWSPLFSGLAGPQVGISNTLTNGYLDLFLTLQGDTGYQSKIVRFVWDGKTYQPKETVATWDGATFVVAK